MKKLSLLSLLVIILGSPAFSQNTYRYKTTVYFNSGQYKLTPETRHILDSVAEMLRHVKNSGNIKVEIIGHTDYIGSDEYNRTLSSKRSEAVHQYLLAKGAHSGARIMNSGFMGEKDPVADNTQKTGRQKNRRVDIVIVYKAEPAATTPAAKADPVPATVPGPEKDNRKMIRGKQGTLVFLDPKDFEEDYLDSAEITVDENLTVCHILGSGQNTMSTDGDCLQTGGMVAVNISRKSVGYAPNGDELIEIWIPTAKPDRDMYVYYDVQGKWKDAKVKPEIRQKDNHFYYVIRSTIQKGWNIDKPICPCPASGPYVKVPMADRQRVYVQLNPDNYTQLVNTKRSKFRMPQTPEESEKKMVKAYAVKNNFVYIANKPLKEVKYRKWNNTYVLRKKDFKKLKMEPNESVTEVLCKVFSE